MSRSSHNFKHKLHCLFCLVEVEFTDICIVKINSVMNENCINHFVIQEFVTDRVTDCPTLEDLGITLTRFQDQALYELKLRRTNLYFEELVGQYADPPFPPEVTDIP